MKTYIITLACILAICKIPQLNASYAPVVQPLAARRFVTPLAAAPLTAAVPPPVYSQRIPLVNPPYGSTVAADPAAVDAAALQLSENVAINAPWWRPAIAVLPAPVYGVPALRRY